MKLFSFQRFLAVLHKEFIHMRRDRLTIGMLVGIPLIQLLLFGYAINLNPRHLPMVVVSQDHSQFTRGLITGIENTKYFSIINPNATEQQALRLIKRNRALFVLNIPADFSHNLVANQHPNILLTVDATDSASTGNAVAAVQQLVAQVLDLQFQRGLAYLQPQAPPYQLIIHNKYNPESMTQYNIVPGLMGVILTMSMIMIMSIAIVRESEVGTMETLLATPVRPLEVMAGKVAPYILVGYFQLLFIWLMAQLLFNIPNQGSLLLLLVSAAAFILANLTVGLTFSTMAKNQLQAVQLTFFFFLPSILLSGFMFPFYGMPVWAQWISEVLPLTHFNRIVRGIMLKGNGISDVWPDIWPLLIFILVSGFVALRRYRQTLD